MTNIHFPDFLLTNSHLSIVSRTNHADNGNTTDIQNPFIRGSTFQKTDKGQPMDPSRHIVFRNHHHRSRNIETCYFFHLLLLLCRFRFPNAHINTLFFTCQQCRFLLKKSRLCFAQLMATFLFSHLCK